MYDATISVTSDLKVYTYVFFLFMNDHRVPQVFRLVSLWFSLCTRQIVVDGMLSTIKEVNKGLQSILVVVTTF